MSHFKEYSKFIPLKNLHPKQFDIITEIDRGSAPECRANLLEDVKARGVLVPLMVQEDANKPGEYNIICGNTRYYIADLLRATGDKRFEKLRCDILADGMDDPELENTAILDNMNRRMITAVARHMMIARYKEQVEKMVTPYRDVNGQFTGASRLSGRTLTPAEETAKVAIEGIQRHGGLDKYVGHVLSIGHDTVYQADRTVNAIRYKLNQRTKGNHIGKTEPRVTRIIEELKNEGGQYGREIFRTPVKKLHREFRQSSSVTAAPTPVKTETVTCKPWPGDLHKSYTEMSKRVRRLDLSKDTPRFTISMKVWKKKQAPY